MSALGCDINRYGQTSNAHNTRLGIDDRPRNPTVINLKSSVLPHPVPIDGNGAPGAGVEGKEGG